MATLILQDGTVIKAKSFGALGGYEGELVFNTSTSGYQEILSDPSYAKQIVVMTYPEIGNVGINDFDFESEAPSLVGLVVKNFSQTESHYKSRESLADYLKSKNIIALEDVDTRSLVQKLRDLGTMNAFITSNDLDAQTIKDKLLDIQTFKIKEDVLRDVSCTGRYIYNTQGKFNVALIDYGVTKSILATLAKKDCRITVYNSEITSKEILENNFDAVFLSSGPADPSIFPYHTTQIRQIMGKLPIFGIGLGFQLLALAIGATTYKLKYGHRGANHPVINLKNNKVIITSQNHGYALNTEDLPKIMRPTYKNLNDDTLEGFEITSLGVYAVQFYPSGDEVYGEQTIYDEWINIVKKDIERINEVKNER